jgi:integrase
MNATAHRVVEYDPLRDKTYQSARLGRDVVDFLAWLELGGTRPRTLDQYERDLARGALMYPGKSVADLTDGDALQIARQFKPGERRVRVAAWRSFLKWAIRTRRADRNPFDVLPTLKRAPKRVFDIFTDAEIAMLCGLPIEDGALMQLMFDCGLRKGDCRQLQWKHFRPDPMPGELALLNGKGGKDRTVSLTLAAAQKLSELGTLNALRSHDHLWYVRRANAISRRVDRSKVIGDGSFDRWWRRCLGAVEVRYRNPHMTRHTYATRWLRRGGRLETLSMEMGHESIRTTFDLYAHLDRTDVLRDLELIQGGLQ